MSNDSSGNKFCSNCGNRLEDNASFCGKCGQAIGQSAMEQIPTSNNNTPVNSIPETKKQTVNPYLKGWKDIKGKKLKEWSAKNKIWVVVHGVIGLLLIVRVVLMFFYNFDLNGMYYYRDSSGHGAVASVPSVSNRDDVNEVSFEELGMKTTVRIGFKTYPVTRVDVSRTNAVHLDGEYEIYVGGNENCKKIVAPNSFIQVYGAVPNMFYLEGRHIKLWTEDCHNIESIFADELEIVLPCDLSSLQWVTCNSVPKNLEYISNMSKYLSIEINTTNDDSTLSESMDDIYFLREAGAEVVLNIEKDISDLYDTWTSIDKDNSFEITFEESGYVRISNSAIFGLGADLLKFEEIDESTLLLKASTDNTVSLVSLEVSYEVIGDKLILEVMGAEIILERK